MRKRPRYLILAALILFSSYRTARAEKVFSEQEFPTTQSKIQRQTVNLDGGYSLLNSTASNISGLTFGLGYQYGHTERWGFQVGALQTTDLSTLGAVSTDYSASLLFALTGRLTHESKRINVNNVPLVQQSSLRTPTFALRAGYTQTLFGGTTNIVSLPGFHAGAQYSRPWSELVDLRLGAEYVSSKSGTREVTQMIFRFGISFWP